MDDQDTSQGARAELTRAVEMSEELIDAHMNAAGHRTSAEWLSALIDRTQVVNTAARGVLDAYPPV